MLGGVDAESEHDDDASRAGSDGKGEGIEGLALEVGDLGAVMAGTAVVDVFRVRRAFFLVEERPADHGDDDAAGDLHDWQGDAEEGEKGRADEFDDGQEDDGVDGDAACERAVGVDGGAADQAEKDQGGAEWVDERKKRAEPQGKEISRSAAWLMLSRWPERV